MRMSIFKQYADDLQNLVSATDWKDVEILANAVRDCWVNENQLFFCGNGGSAGNAIHLANDFVYGCSAGVAEKGLRVQALSANPATMTCLANDVGFESIYSIQLKTFAQKNDLLIVFSGSGNSPNIIHALEAAREIGVKTAAILGFSGGKAKDLADIPIHFPIDNMQISEDMQLVVGHMIMRWLRANPPD
ncbi:MAG: phosphoheptose isomerase [Sulfitobacter sp.]|nr:MAG: phosphoheptose isomerase [Sulfitobacter sp.]